MDFKILPPLDKVQPGPSVNPARNERERLGTTLGQGLDKGGPQFVEPAIIQVHVARAEICARNRNLYFPKC